MSVTASAAAAVSTAGLALTVLNAATAPRVRARSANAVDQSERVTVCIPARDEVATLPLLIADLRAQRPPLSMRVLVLDDRSTDGTAAATLEAIDGDTRFTVLTGAGPSEPEDIGKSVACITLGRAALEPDPDQSDTAPTVLVFLDADVRLTPDAIAAAVVHLRRSKVALLSPWPLQRAGSPSEHLVQPLLCWSWSATLPLPLANRARGASTAVAIGQFLVMDAPSYARINGHESTRTSITDDLALARTFRSHGLHTAVAYAGEVASCRMYESAAQVREGYTRWLWSAFGPVGTPLVVGAAVIAYVVPAVQVVTGRGSRRLAALAWGAAAASRIVARRSERSTIRTGAFLSTVAGAAADTLSALAHPAAAAAAAALVTDSVRGRRRGTLTWKNRRLDV